MALRSRGRPPGIKIPRYKLVKQVAVLEPDLVEWANWFEHADRIVARTELPRAIVSTIFLGVDKRPPYESGPPLLFETRVFVNGDNLLHELCSTWEEAAAQHARVVQEWLTRGIK